MNVFKAMETHHSIAFFNNQVLSKKRIWIYRSVKNDNKEKN